MRHSLGSTHKVSAWWLLVVLAIVASIAIAQSGGSTYVLSSTSSIPAGSKAQATFTIDGMNGNSPGLDFINFGAGANAITIQSGDYLCLNRPTDTTCVQDSSGNFKFFGLKLDTNGLALTNSSGSGGGNVLIADGKTLRLLSSSTAGIIESSSVSGQDGFDMNTLVTHAAGDNCWVQNNNGTLVVEYTCAGNEFLNGSILTLGGASASKVISASGQNMTFDCGGGTCTAALGGTNATTTTVGRSGQTSNLLGTIQVGGNALDQTFCLFTSGNLAATNAFGETTFTSAATADTGSKITQDVVGVGAGNFVIMACLDGTTCAAGNRILTYTESCTAAVGTRTAATVQNSGTIAAGSLLTVSVTTACATTDPAVNVCVHSHY